MIEELDYTLAAPPGDSISCIKFLPSSNNLLVSSWDSVRHPSK